MRKTTTSTPWGKADFSTPIVRGVVWYTTPSHGGLMVTPTAAKKFLSDAAIASAESWGGSYWYEEDCAYSVALYDSSDLCELFNIKQRSSNVAEDHLHVIKNYFPEYLIRKSDGYTIPGLPSVGDKLRFDSNVSYGRNDVPEGTVVVIDAVCRDAIVFSYNGAKSIPLSFVRSGRVSVVS